MLAVTILFTLLQSLLTQAQVDIHEKHEGYTIEKSDPNAGGGEIYTSSYQLQKFFEEEQCKYCHLKMKGLSSEASLRYCIMKL